MPIMKNARRHGSQDENRSRKRVNTEGALETFNSFTISESLTLSKKKLMLKNYWARLQFSFGIKIRRNQQGKTGRKKAKHSTRRNHSIFCIVSKEY